MSCALRENFIACDGFDTHSAARTIVAYPATKATFAVDIKSGGRAAPAYQEADIETDIKADDRGELVSLMVPLTLGEGYRHRARITDLAFELAQKAAGFRRSLPGSLLSSLASLVRSQTGSPT